jgi:DNA repair protein RecO (recombination protein O)
MKRWRTRGIVLRRVNFGEADRIITFLTPEGKIGVMAKGVRKPRSKLAGGIELFSESDITLIEGRGQLDIIISARLIKHYPNIIKEYERVQIGYLAIQAINKNTQDDTDASHYDLLKNVFVELDNLDTPVVIISSWFYLKLLDELGHRPNLTHDSRGQKLNQNHNYNFNIEDATFEVSSAGNLSANHIKSWRLLLANPPSKLRKITDMEQVITESEKIIKQLFEYHATI